MCRARKLLFIAILFFPISLIAQTTYYVSSSEGNDANPGTTTSQPWQSLVKVNSFTPRPGDQILFKRGDEWSGTITVNASGTAGNPIAYGAYGTGEEPVISGSVPITGWTLHSGNIYKANLNSTINQLFLDDERIMNARYPNTGYLPTTSVQSTSQFTSGSLIANIDYTGATWIGRVNRWNIITRTITASSSQTLNINSALGSLSNKTGFFLCNKLEFLDSAGEWYYDDAANTVYLWTPHGDTPENYAIRGAVYDDIITINSKKYVSIENLSLQRSASRGIYTSGNCSHILLNNNTIIDHAVDGIKLTGSSHTITNNIVTGSCQEGMWLNITSSKIIDNQILNTGLFENIGISGTGILGNSRAVGLWGGGNVFRYNRIIKSGYNGIAFNGENLIEYNYIDSMCLVTDDGAAIYTFSTDVNAPGAAGSIIRNNIVLNAIGNHDGYPVSTKSAMGIYMDNRIRDVVIENNTVAHSSGISIFLHDNKNIEVKSNVIFDGGKGTRATGTYGGNSIHDNIFYALDKYKDKDDTQKLVQINAEDNTVTMFNNHYVSHYNDDVYINKYSILTFDQWKSVTGQGANSTTDHSPLAAGETEKLFYNDTKQVKAINLGSSVYRDVYGNPISGTLILEPFTSKILIGTKFDQVPSEDTAKPSCLGGVLEDSNRIRIILSFSELLQETSVPSPSDFILSNNKTVQQVTINGSDIYLDVDSEYQYGDDIKLSYNKGNVAIQDLAGNEADAFIGNNVHNNIVNKTLPDLSPTFSEYLFEESTGATVIDSQGTNNGTIFNDVLRENGVSGNGLKLTGLGYVNLGQSFGDNVQDEVTLSSWIKPTATMADYYQGIIMHGGPNIDSYALYVNPHTKSIGFKTSGTSSSWISVENVDDLWDGEWHFLAATYNGSQKIIYLDGAVLASADATGIIESGEGYNLLIGAGRDETAPTQLFQGFIDEVRIYNTALTNSEIRDLESIATNNGGISEIISPCITIYPNPSDGNFTLIAENLKSDVAEISLFNMTGKQVAKLEFNNVVGSSLQENINLSDLNKGIYILRLVCEDQTCQSKVIFR